MDGYQLKLAVKNAKPPVWKRCMVPSGITFAQLSIILEEVMELPDTDRYEFEFYHKEIHLREWREGERAVTRYNYDYMCASDTYINGLFEEKGWFTFRIEGGVQYRVTIEKYIPDLEILCPVIVKQKDYQESGVWTDIEEKNHELKQLLSIKYCEKEDYRTHKALREELNKEPGLKGSTAAADRQEHNQKSSFNMIREFANLLMEWGPYVNGASDGKNPLPDIRDIIGERKTESQRWGNLKRYFLSYEKGELKEIAKELNLLRYNNLSREELAEKIKNELLSPSVMRNRMLLFDDEEIAVFEGVAEKGGCYFPPKDILDRLFPFYRLHYIIIYEDDCVEVPSDVARLYGQINMPEYRDRRRKASWMYDCLLMTEMIYGAAPAKIVHRMYRRRQGYKVGYEEFLHIFKMIPEGDNPCVLHDNRIIAKSYFHDREYIKIEQAAESLEYYIPEADEVRDYVGNGYPSRDECWKKLRYFLGKELRLEEEHAEELIQDIWDCINRGYGISEVMDIFNQEEVAFPSDSAFKKFISLISEVQEDSRRILFRGNRLRDRLRAESGGILAAQTERLMERSCGSGEEVRKSVKKIYPNDPCPCGSGKKYKKCCGRR